MDFLMLRRLRKLACFFLCRHVCEFQSLQYLPADGSQLALPLWLPHDSHRMRPDVWSEILKGCLEAGESGPERGWKQSRVWPVLLSHLYPATTFPSAYDVSQRCLSFIDSPLIRLALVLLLHTFQSMDTLLFVTFWALFFFMTNV